MGSTPIASTRESFYKQKGFVGIKIKTLKELGLEHIHKTLVYCDWDRNEAHKILDISSRGLRNKIKELRDLGYKIETTNVRN